MKIKAPFHIKPFGGRNGSRWLYLRDSLGHILQALPMWKEAKSMYALRSIPGETNDCTVLAVAAASGLDYKTVWQAAHEAGRKPRGGFYCRRIIAKLADQGHLKDTDSVFMYDNSRWKRGPRRTTRPYPTLSEVMPLMEKGSYVVETSDHAFAVKDGIVYDGQRVKLRYRVQRIQEVQSPSTKV